MKNPKGYGPNKWTEQNLNNLGHQSTYCSFFGHGEE